MLQGPCTAINGTAVEVSQCASPNSAECVNGADYQGADQQRTNPQSSVRQAGLVVSIVGLVLAGIAAFLSLFMCGWKGIR